MFKNAPPFPMGIVMVLAAVGALLVLLFIVSVAVSELSTITPEGVGVFFGRIANGFTAAVE